MPNVRDEPSFQEGLHVATSVRHAVDGDLGADDTVDHTPGLVVQFAVFGGADSGELFRKIS